MVNTKKFSEFTLATTETSSDQVVGLASGANAKFPKVVSWTTSTRPAPFNGVLGFNTTLDHYEFYSTTRARWVQITDS